VSHVETNGMARETPPGRDAPRAGRLKQPLDRGEKSSNKNSGPYPVNNASRALARRRKVERVSELNLCAIVERAALKLAGRSSFVLRLTWDGGCEAKFCFGMGDVPAVPEVISRCQSD
jgi:hypothetical protein